VIFWRFLAAKMNYDEMDGDRLRLPANKNCYRLSRVSWALLKFLVWFWCSSSVIMNKSCTTCFRRFNKRLCATHEKDNFCLLFLITRGLLVACKNFLFQNSYRLHCKVIGKARHLACGLQMLSLLLYAVYRANEINWTELNWCYILLEINWQT